MTTSIKKTRRVSFDLELNTIHLLPTEKQVKEQADKLRREAYQNRTLVQELLDDSIVSEIMAACSCSLKSSPTDGDSCLKSCLKQQQQQQLPLLIMTNKNRIKKTPKHRQQKQQIVSPRRAHTTKNDDSRKPINSH